MTQTANIDHFIMKNKIVIFYRMIKVEEMMLGTIHRSELKVYFCDK